MVHVSSLPTEPVVLKLLKTLKMFTSLHTNWYYGLLLLFFKTTVILSPLNFSRPSNRYLTWQPVNSVAALKNICSIELTFLK